MAEQESKPSHMTSGTQQLKTIRGNHRLRGDTPCLPVGNPRPSAAHTELRRGRGPTRDTAARERWSQDVTVGAAGRPVSLRGQVETTGPMA